MLKMLRRPTKPPATTGDTPNMSSPMCQDMFGVSPVVAGGFVGLLSIFNMVGRFLWSSTSDLTGRKAIYCVYFILGCALYCLIPFSQRIGSVTLFVGLTCVI